MAKGGCLNGPTPATPLGRLGELWTLNIGLFWLNGDETGITLAAFSPCCGGCARCTAPYCRLSAPNDLCRTSSRPPKRGNGCVSKTCHEPEQRRAAAAYLVREDTWSRVLGAVEGGELGERGLLPRRRPERHQRRRGAGLACARPVHRRSSCYPSEVS
jgi:hypothetical protein